MSENEFQLVEVSAGVDTDLVALVGRRDEPVDALRDYCAWLGEALDRRGVAMQLVEVRWDQRGWLRALASLWKQSGAWRGRWVLLQYTALMWSRRGFPVSVPLILVLLRLRGCRTAILLHDACPRGGTRWIDRFRLRVQLWAIRRAHAQAERILVSLPKSKVYWLAPQAPKVFFVPVGANLPSWEDLSRNGDARPSQPIRTVAVFGVSTWHQVQKQEVEAICYAMKSASARLGDLNLLVIGRGAKEAETALREGLASSSVRLILDGLLDSREISSRLSACDVQLFVRGPLSTRRGSGLAGVACGVPVVAYEGSETGPPLTDAGIVFVPQNDLCSLAKQLTELLCDEPRRQMLSERNRMVFHEWFSWDRIAERLVEALNSADRVGSAGSPAWLDESPRK